MESNGALDALCVALSHVETTRAQECLQNFSRDESGLGDFFPQVVVFPKNTAQVQEVIRGCQRFGVPVTPVGGRTGKSGGCLPLFGGVALSFEKMNSILQISREDAVAVVQPGVVLQTLQEQVEAAGLFYPPDPNSFASCTLGGNVAENAGGPNALKYGVTRDYVLGMEWVLPSGEVLRVGHRTHKGVAGYDLVGLFVGSEGTLGVATEITLKLLPKPHAVKTGLLCFATLADAASAVGQMLNSGLLPRCLELLDDVAICAVDGKGFAFPQGTAACLLVEVDGVSDDAVTQQLYALAASQRTAIETVVAQDSSQRLRLWEIRRQVSPSLKALKGFKLSEDIVVPRSKIPLAIERFKAIGNALGLTVATYGHAGDGNLHTNVLFSSPKDKPRVESAVARILEATIELEGSITGEHGVGLAKKGFLPLELSEPSLCLQLALKRLLDPSSRLNPGKIFDKNTCD